MNEGNIFFAKQNGIYFIQLRGSMRFTVSQGLDKLIGKITNDRDVRELVIDLTHAEYLDSTILGMLAKTAKISISRFHKHPVLISNKTDVNMVLESMGFEQVFQIVADYTLSNPETMDITDTIEPADARLLLDAHRQLSSLNAKNGDTFRDVIELLESGQRI